MKQFKYILDRSNKKFHCPRCGKKRYVRFIKTETKEYLDYDYGRCDREQSCSYFQYPNQTLSITDTISISYSEPSYMNPELIEKTMVNYHMNSFVNYLRSSYDDCEVDQAIEKYRIGTAMYLGGSTVFWQIDRQNRVHAGKIMKYEKSTGKRDKSIRGSINWAHSVMKLEEFNLSQCLFGEHLVTKEVRQVALVESEKSAIIMSIIIPDFTWLATGSKTGFKYESMKPLKEVEIHAFPDKGCYNDWFEKAQRMNAEGFSITVSKKMETDSIKDGDDIVDLLANNSTVYSSIEKKIHKLVEKNSSIKRMIQLFNLEDNQGRDIRFKEEENNP